MPKSAVPNPDEAQPTLLEVGANWHERLHNDRTWKDSKGEVHTITAMEPSHRANVKRYLRQRVASIRMAVEFYEIAIMPPDMGEIAADIIERELQGLWDMKDMEWLYHQPLFAALVQADVPA